MKKLMSIMVVAIMLVFSAVPVFAADDVVSPIATEPTQPSTYKYEVVVIPTEGGDGSYEFTTEIDEDGNQHVHIKPSPNPGYTFDHWVIEGPYTTTDEFTSDEMDLIITGDIKVTPYYVKDGEPATKPVTPDNNQTSPQTGASDALPYAVMFLSLAACGGAAAVLVKSKKSSK